MGEQPNFSDYLCSVETGLLRCPQDASECQIFRWILLYNWYKHIQLKEKVFEKTSFQLSRDGPIKGQK